MREGNKPVKDEILELLAEATTIFSKGRRSDRTLPEDVHLLAQRLHELAKRSDPIKHPDFTFDPGDPRQMGRIAACELLLQPRHRLDELDKVKFYGSGIYAIYYVGDFHAYKRLSKTETPIYVGKANPQDPAAPNPKGQGTKLWERVNEHFKNIKNVKLPPSEFMCRYLVVKSGMQTAAEEYLIHYFKPIWNNQTNICYGIGKHGDKASTRGNKRSPWDVIHPGRKWAASEELKDQKTVEVIVEEINNHLDKFKPLLEIDFKDVLLP